MVTRILEYLKDMKKVLELAEKPDSDEFKTLFKLILLGFLAVGGLSFGISLLISTILSMYQAAPS